MLLGLALAACGGGGGGSSPPPVPPSPPSPTVTIPDLGAYFATSVCPDGSLAVFSACAGRPQRASDPMRWRHADTSRPPADNDGQIADDFLSDDGRYYVAGFSYPPNGVFSAAHNDGGDIEVVEGSVARISYTRPLTNDPTTEGYWVGPGCGGTGWLVADNAAPTGPWRSTVAMLAGSQTRGACPPLGPAYTQWRLETATVPFTIAGVAHPLSLPVIISEHYAGVSTMLAGAMERFIFARGVGKVAWEAWTRSPPAAPVSWACPGLAPWNGPPGAGWYLRDRRCWSAIVLGSGMTGAQWGWPGAGYLP